MTTRLKHILYPMLRCVDFILQVCAPVKDKRLCYASFPDYSDNAYHLYRHALSTRSGLEHIWLIKHMNGLSERIEADFRTITRSSGTTGNRLRIVKRQSLYGYWLYLTSRHVFHTHGIYQFPQRSIKRNIVSLWHGMPVKRIGALNRTAYNEFPTFGTLYTATSHFFKYIVACAFSISAERVLVCPYPRTDTLSHKAARTVDNTQIKTQLQVPADTRLVLWLPTFRTEPFRGTTAKITVRSFLDDINPEMLEALDDAARQQGAVVMIKLHPYDRLNELGTQLDYPQLRVITASQWQSLGIPLYDLAAASSGLLTDISSIMIDYLATQRPIGIIGHDPDSYTRGATFPLSHLFASGCFQRLGNANDIEHFMAAVGRDEPRDDRAQALSEIFLEPAAIPGSECILRHLGL